MREPISPEEAERRLQIIFPRAAFDSVLSNPLAGMAVAALIHVNAVCSKDDDPDTVVWARPSTVVWMSDEALARSSDADRVAWRTAAAKGSKQVEALHAQWDAPLKPRYKENSRETLRDETFRSWLEHGALRRRQGVPTSSSKPTWALLDDFADLFRPDLSDADLEQAANEWRENHLTPGNRLRAMHAIATEAAEHEVIVTLPDGTTRKLSAGESSKIIKGVIESWAPIRLAKPVVLTISEPRVPVHLGDEQTLRALGISIDVANVLPDLMIADIDAEPVQFWIIEAVASDGPITDARRRTLLAWAAQQHIRPDQCSFLTAFLSRNHAAAKRRLKDIATGTWAWFLDEPGHELAWYTVVPSANEL